MKKSIFILFAAVVCTITSGCYDMVDIEDIGAVSAIFVDSDSIIYCTVTASPDEKKYNYDFYSSWQSNLYQGINSLSERTGKKISLSHLQAIMFSEDCTPDRVKENINALLGRTNSHPKSLVAYYKGRGEQLASELMKEAQNVGSNHLARLLDNRFSGMTVCNATEFCYGVNFEGGGTAAPLITTEGGDIAYKGVVYTNNQGFVSIPRPYGDIVTAIKNKGKGVSYGEDAPIEIRCTFFDVIYDKFSHRADISAEFLYSSFGNKPESDALGKDIREGLEYIASLKDSGFDVFDIYTDIKKSFSTIPSFERYIASRGGGVGCVRSAGVNIKTGVGGYE